MKKQMKYVSNALATVLSLSILAGCSPFGQSDGNQLTNSYTENTTDKATALWIDGSSFTPVLRFVAGSDVHIGEDISWNPGRYRLGYLFDDIYDYASTQEYDRLDAVILNGDLCERGTEWEYKALMEEIEKHARQEETIVMASFAGHEILDHYNKGAENDAVEFITSQTGLDPATHLKIKGFHFVVVSNMYTEANLPVGYDKQWVLDAFSNAAEDGGSQPIFTFFHHPVNDTILWSEKDRNDYPDRPVFAEEMEAYPQIVYFSGHYHTAIRHPAALVQTSFTSIDTGAVDYFSVISQNKFDGVNDKVLKSYTSTHTSAGGGMHVIEVDANNRIRVMPYNLAQRKFYNAMGENSNEQLIYYIEDASDPSTWLYKKAGSAYAEVGESREEKSTNPYFADNAQIQDLTITQDSIDFKFPHALDDDGVESYTIIVKDENGNSIIAEPVSSEYYLENGSKEMTISYTREVDTYSERAYNDSDFSFIDPNRTNLSGTTWQEATYAFEDGKTYTLEIVAYDCWSKKSTGATQGQTSLKYTFTVDFLETDGLRKA